MKHDCVTVICDIILTLTLDFRKKNKRKKKYKIRDILK